MQWYQQIYAYNTFSAHLAKGNVSFCHHDFLEINQSETRIAFGGHVC
jgi:hypothetical protein